jgi:hypothetical protein
MSSTYYRWCKKKVSTSALSPDSRRYVTGVNEYDYRHHVVNFIKYMAQSNRGHNNAETTTDREKKSR